MDTQGYRHTAVAAIHRDTGVQRYWDTWIKRYSDTEIKGYKETKNLHLGYDKRYKKTQKYSITGSRVQQ